VSSNKAIGLTLRRAAMDLLARREHSRAELLDKLQRKFPENVEAFAQVLDQLALDGLLDDARFTEAYIRYRRTRGVGPLLVRQELRQKGIDGATLESALDLQSDDWHESLLALMDKKTQGTVPPKSDVKARQKLYRALLAKGYSSGMIARAFLRL
jgi:regulatory protein